jgi:hypothetical protein
MDLLIGVLRRAYGYVIKNWFVFFALLTYVFFSAFYMGPAFYKCNDSLYGFGDSTAGPIWKESLKPSLPVLGGYETATNFPKGESLYSPVNYASLVQSFVIKGMSRAVGPVCAYNLYNIFGYLTTSMIMFAFVLYLTRNRWVALLAGYAVAFTPYIQSKIGGHPSYGYAALLIALIWLALHLITHRRKVHAILLGTVLGVCAYFDPYFILLAITVAVPIIVSWGYIGLRKNGARVKIDRKSIVAWMKPFAISILVFALLVTPLLVIRIKDAGLIESSVGGVRGNVTAAAMLCSNKPLDYLLPDPNNKYLVGIFGSHYSEVNMKYRNWCGFGESRVSISLTMLVLLALTLVIVMWDRANRRTQKISDFLPYDRRLVVGAIAGIGILAFLLGLPPSMNGFITPTGLLLKVTEMWRIFAREYLLVNVAIVLAFAITLKYFTTTSVFKNRRIVKSLIYILLFLGIFAEYQINDPFSPPTFSYSRDIPQVYREIKDNKDIKVLAEYPIDRMGIEHDSTVYYLTMQAVHGKKILNSAAIKDSNENIHIALKDLSDPQTIPALRYLGINYVVIHGEKENDIVRKLKNIKVLGRSDPAVYALTMVRSDDDHDIILAKLLDGPKTSSILTFEKGFVVNLEIMDSPIGMEYEALQNTELKVTPLDVKGEKLSKNISKQCFDVKMSLPTDKSVLYIEVNGNRVTEEGIDGNYRTVQVDAKPGDVIRLHNSMGYNMRLSNLGCKAE